MNQEAVFFLNVLCIALLDLLLLSLESENCFNMALSLVFTSLPSIVQVFVLKCVINCDNDCLIVSTTIAMCIETDESIT